MLSRVGLDASQTDAERLVFSMMEHSDVEVEEALAAADGSECEEIEAYAASESATLAGSRLGQIFFGYNSGINSIVHDCAIYTILALRDLFPLLWPDCILQMCKFCCQVRDLVRRSRSLARIFVLNVDMHLAMISSDVSSSGCPFRTAGETVRTEN